MSSIDKTHETGPFDIIGDIHGCYNELCLLLTKLGYEIDAQGLVMHPQHRKLIFVGDLVDRGPNSPAVLKLVMRGVADQTMYCVNGNHDDKLRRKLEGRDVKIMHGLQETLDQLDAESDAFRYQVHDFLATLQSHLILDGGKLVIAHAGIKAHYIGEDSKKIKAFCMYGQPTGEIDEYGFPVRYPWANEYGGNALIVYGHSVVKKAEFINNTINIDTGCVFGGQLTALRYPEQEIVAVDAVKAYY